MIRLVEVVVVIWVVPRVGPWVPKFGYLGP